MNKTISFIFTTTILFNFLLAGGGANRQQRKAKNAHQQYLDLTQYKVPITYIDCSGDMHDVAKRALMASAKKNLLKHTPTQEQLENSKCEWGLSTYDWFRITYTNAEGRSCSVLTVTAWHTIPKGRNYDYVLIDDQTKKSNQDLAVCEGENLKIQTDEAAQEEQPNHIVNNEEVYEELDEVNTYGPGGMTLALRPQLESEVRAFVPEEPVEEDEVAHTEHDNLINQHLLGGWSLCSAEDIAEVPRYFAMLIAQNQMTGIVVYSQNVVRCEKQLVNGMNYNIVVSFNHKQCQAAYHREFSGTLSTFSTAPKFDNVAECLEMFHPNN